MCLLEKAWAKLYGTYARIEGGDPGFALAHLTGNPAMSMFHEDVKDLNEFWGQISHADSRDYTMVSAGSGYGEKAMENGVISGHAYTFISTHEFTHQETSYCLVKLRNPWGEKEWTGDWSDHSPLWTDELRKQLGSRAADDGEFFMCF